MVLVTLMAVTLLQKSRQILLGTHGHTMYRTSRRNVRMCWAGLLKWDVPGCADVPRRRHMHMPHRLPHQACPEGRSWDRCLHSARSDARSPKAAIAARYGPPKFHRRGVYLFILVNASAP